LVDDAAVADPARIGKPVRIILETVFTGRPAAGTDRPQGIEYPNPTMIFIK
jgi:hypothetical protein